LIHDLATSPTQTHLGLLSRQKRPIYPPSATPVKKQLLELLSQANRRQGSPPKDYIVPVQPNTPSNKEYQGVEGWSTCFGNSDSLSQPPGCDRLFFHWSNLLVAQLAQHQEPNFTTVDIVEQQMVDLLVVLQTQRIVHIISEAMPKLAPVRPASIMDG
jgi:hypothetical protein